MSTSASLPKLSAPKLTPAEKNGLRDFWRVYEARRGEVTAQLLRMASKHPEFKFIMRNAPAQRSAEDERAGTELQRQAIFDGKWKPYLKSLQVQGMQYAQAGLSFHAWFEIVGAFRTYMVPYLLEAYGKTPKRLLSAIHGIDILIDLTMSVIGESYLETKEQLITQQQEAIQRGQVQLAAIINSAMDAIITIDEGQRILIFNPAAEKMFMRFADKVIGKPLTLLIPERWHVSHEKDVRTFQETPSIARAMGRLRTVYGLRANGEEFPLEVTISQIQIGTKKAFTAILRDITERIRAEETLREAELKYRTLVEQIPNVITYTDSIDSMTSTLYVSPQIQDILGYSPSEWMALPNGWSGQLHPDDHDRTVAENERHHATGEPFRQEYRLLAKDGRIVWIRDEAVIVRDEAGRGRYSHGIMIDITELRRADQALRESEERFATAFRSSPTPIAITRLADGKISDVNEAFCQLFGFSRDEIVGHTSLELGMVEPDSRQRAVERLKDTGVIRNLEQQARSRSGELLNILSSIDTINVGGQSYALTTIIDISERKRAEALLQKAHDELEIQVEQRTAALSQSNALLQMMLDYVPDHVYFKDSSSHFIRNSRSQAKALGLNAPAEAAGKSDFDFFPHAQRSYEEEQEMMRSGEPLVDFEEQVVWPDGKETWVSTTKTPLRDQADKIIGIFGISRDITDRKRAERELQKAKADLEAANKELEAFAYSVSHDLRAPLRSIDGFSQALLEDYGDRLPAEGQGYLQRVRAAAQHMAELIDDLLNLSRVARSPLEPKAVDLSELAERILAELQRTQPERAVEVSIAPNLTANCDAHLMRIVLDNLLSNAWKFTSKRERARIEFGRVERGDSNAFFVRDNGAGFDMTYGGKLFGAFQRLHTASEFPGTGVGLATVQRVIHRHGGRVWAEGVVDEGSSFYFTLP